MVFQDFNLFHIYLLKENVTHSLLHVLKMDKKKQEQRALDLLQKMGLEDKANAYPCNLSGGQKQKSFYCKMFSYQS